MAHKWNREKIIRTLLQRESKGLPLTTGGDDGVEPSLYQAGGRIFGSWRNALASAGISPDRVLSTSRWTPDRILSTIRILSRRRRPLTNAQLLKRYGAMMAAARRFYGSWTKAVIAAGVDPMTMRKVPPWTRDRILEAILTRALNNHPLRSQSTEPRSLVDAARRVFGSWDDALIAAGLNPGEVRARVRRSIDVGETNSATGKQSHSKSKLRPGGQT